MSYPLIRSGDRGIWSENSRYYLYAQALSRLARCALLLLRRNAYRAICAFALMSKTLQDLMRRKMLKFIVVRLVSSILLRLNSSMQICLIIENDHDLMEKFAEFQLKTIFFSSFIVFWAFYCPFGHFRLRPNAPAPFAFVTRQRHISRLHSKHIMNSERNSI